MSRHSRAVLVVALAAGCVPAPPVDAFALHRSLQLARTIEIAAPAGPAAEAAHRAAGRIERSGLFEVDLIAPAEDAGGARPRILIGGPDTPGMPAVLERLGLRWTDDGFDGTREVVESCLAVGEGPSFDAFVATLADPERPGLPLTVACAGSPERAAPFAARLSPAWRPSFNCWRAGDPWFAVDLRPDGSFRIETTRVLLEPPGEEPELSARPGIELSHPPGWKGDERAYLAALERARKVVLDLLGPDAEGAPPVRVRLVEHPEDLARTGWELSRVNPVTGDVTTYVGDGFDDGGYGLARSLALRVAGAPARPWMLDGVAARAASGWWGRAMPAWVAGLTEGGLVPPLEDLVADEPVHSPHLVTPLRGALVTHLEQIHGAAAFAALWSGADELVLDAELRDSFARRLEDLRIRHAERLLRARGDGIRRILHQPFRHGVNLIEPEREGSLLGFGTRASEQSLENAAALGVDAIALVATGFVDAGLPARALEPLADPLATSTPDLALVATMRTARARDMSVMVRPFLLQTRSGTWAGEHIQETQETLVAFFEDYQRFLVHFALLAELGGADLLCVGTELLWATRIDDEADPWIPDYVNDNHERWRGLIRAARGAFTGGLTYAADWRGEAPKVGFWPELDFVGMNLFPSLATPPGGDGRPEDWQASQRVRSMLTRLTDLTDAHGRPGLVIEVGFAPTSQAWIKPMESRGELDASEQAWLYRSLDDALRRLNLPTDRLGGLYLWAWSTDPDAGRGLDRSWTPQNRPAAEAVAELFGD